MVCICCVHAMRGVQVAATESGGRVYDGMDIAELTTADASAFAVSIVTTDGQCIDIGDTQLEFPIMGVVRPFLHALAVQDCGHEEVGEWCGEEPTVADRLGFSLMPPQFYQPPAQREGGGTALQGAGTAELTPDNTAVASSATTATASSSPLPPHPRPWNPYTEAGSLLLSALIGRAARQPEQRLFHDQGTRWTHTHTFLQRIAGYRRVGFNNSLFLGQKEKRLQSLAIAYYMKGMGALPARSDPVEAAHALFQAEAVDVNTSSLAMAGATLANNGVCPATQEECVREDAMPNLLATLYHSGLAAFTGLWMFTTGVPACSGVSGALVAIVPGIMSIAIYSPALNAAGVSPRAVRFCEMLAAMQPMSLFDRLVNIPPVAGGGAGAGDAVRPTPSADAQGAGSVLRSESTFSPHTASIPRGESAGCAATPKHAAYSPRHARGASESQLSATHDAHAPHRRVASYSHAALVQATLHPPHEAPPQAMASSSVGHHTHGASAPLASLPPLAHVPTASAASGWDVRPAHAALAAASAPTLHRAHSASDVSAPAAQARLSAAHTGSSSLDA
ncbi:hypothetical protein EON66_04940, partial [archaeon]